MDILPGAILDGLRRELENVHNIHFALRVATHLAVARFKAKQVTEALKTFGGVVSAFARAGIYQTISDEGDAEIGPLLATFQDNAERTGSSQELMSYTSNLISAWTSRYQSDPQQPQTPTVTYAISEPLTPEIDILELIAEGNLTRRLRGTLTSPPKR